MKFIYLFTFIFLLISCTSDEENLNTENENVVKTNSFEIIIDGVKFDESYNNNQFGNVFSYGVVKSADLITISFDNGDLANTDSRCSLSLTFNRNGNFVEGSMFFF